MVYKGKCCWFQTCKRLCLGPWSCQRGSPSVIITFLNKAISERDWVEWLRPELWTFASRHIKPIRDSLILSCSATPGHTEPSASAKCVCFHFDCVETNRTQPPEAHCCKPPEGMLLTTTTAGLMNESVFLMVVITWAEVEVVRFLGLLKRKELKPSVSDRGWQEELQQWTVRNVVKWILEPLNLFQWTWMFPLPLWMLR